MRNSNLISLFSMALLVVFFTSNISAKEKGSITGANTSDIKLYSKEKKLLKSVPQAEFAKFVQTGIPIKDRSPNNKFLIIDYEGQEVMVKARQVQTNEDFGLPKCIKKAASENTVTRGAAQCNAE